MIQVGAPQELREIDGALLHFVDLVARRQACQAIRPATRTAREIAQVQGAPARIDVVAL
jgi:hypothetical protein